MQTATTATANWRSSARSIPGSWTCCNPYLQQRGCIWACSCVNFHSCLSITSRLAMACCRNDACLQLGKPLICRSSNSSSSCSGSRTSLTCCPSVHLQRQESDPDVWQPPARAGPRAGAVSKTRLPVSNSNRSSSCCCQATGKIASRRREQILLYEPALKR